MSLWSYVQSKLSFKRVNPRSLPVQRRRRMAYVILKRRMAKEVMVPGNTVLELIEYWGSTSDSDIAAFVSIDASGRKRAVSRKEVLDLSKRFAHRLNAYGIQKGSIVSNTLPNSLERVICEFGILFSGASSINGQILRSDGEDFLEALKTSRCVAVILDPNVPKSARQVLLREVPVGCEDSVQSERLPDLRKLIICARDDADGENDFINSLRNSHLPQFRADVHPDDLATVMTTSGSTGYSKLVKHSHADICHFGKQVKAIEPLPSGAHFINSAQLGWAAGYPQWYLSCGVTRYFIDVHDGPPADVPSTLWRIMVEEKIDYGFLTPMFVNAILTKSPWETAEWKPKILCLAGQPIKKVHMNIIGKLCEAVDVNYGMTECNLVTTHRIVDPSTYVDGCAGYPGYGVKIKIVDANREEVAQGSIGEILVWSPSLCSGYLNNESARTSVFTSDGWFCTDDAGYIGADGKVYVEGRQSDSIMRGVYILYPGWLEKKMKEYPGVMDVAIVAVPDAVLHNEVCACIVANGVNGVVAGYGNDAWSNGVSRQLEDEVDRAAYVKNDVSMSLNDKHAVVGSSQNGDIKGADMQNLDLILFEKDLRNFANDLSLLHEKDAMRMVPKYYVFVEKFPLTPTGKMSRREIRKIAVAALGIK